MRDARSIKTNNEQQSKARLEWQFGFKEQDQTDNYGAAYQRAEETNHNGKPLGDAPLGISVK